MCACTWVCVHTHLPSGEESRAFPDFTEADLDCIFVHPELFIEKKKSNKEVCGGIIDGENPRHKGIWKLGESWLVSLSLLTWMWLRLCQPLKMEFFLLSIYPARIGEPKTHLKIRGTLEASARSGQLLYCVN